MALKLTHKLLFVLIAGVFVAGVVFGTYIITGVREDFINSSGEILKTGERHFFGIAAGQIEKDKEFLMKVTAHVVKAQEESFADIPFELYQGDETRIKAAILEKTKMIKKRYAKNINLFAEAMVEEQTKIIKEEMAKLREHQIEQSHIVASQLQVKAAITMLLVIAFLIIGNSMLLNRIVCRPIRRLLEGTKRIAKGDLGYRLNTVSRDELGVLASSFNYMAERLEQLIESEKELSAKAAAAEVEKKRAIEQERAYHELKKVQERLGESEEKFRSIAETAQAAILMLDDQGKLVYWNRQASRIFGYTAEEALGQDGILFLAPERYHDAHCKAYQEFARTGAGPVVGKTLELAAVRKDGSEFPVELSVSGVKLNGKWHATGIMRDITERKQIEESLQKLSRAVEQSPVSVVITDQAGTIEYVNPKFIERTGYSFEEAVGQNPRILNSGQQSPEFYKDLWETITSGREWHGQFVNRKKSGELYWESASISAVRDHAGEITHYIAVKEDVTELKRAEEELKRSEASLALAQQIAHLGSWELDLVSNNLRWSAEVYRIFEIDPEAFSPSYEAFNDAIHPDDREFVNKDFTDSVRNRTAYNIEHRLLMKDGRIKYVNERGETVYDTEDKPLKSTGTVQDITERKLAEQALEEAYNIINGSPAVVFLWKNAEGWPVEFVSDNVMTLFGYTAKEFISGQVSYMKTIHPDDLELVAEEVLTYSKEKRRASFVHAPYRIVTKDGKVKWLDDNTFIRRDNKGKITHYEGICLDVTERKAAEQALAQAKKVAEVANLAKSEFLANMSHELRTPLNTIIGFADLLSRGMAGDLADNQKEYIIDIGASGKHLLSLISDILDLSKVEAGKMELDLAEFRMCELIDQSLAMFREKAMKHRIKLEVEGNQGLPPVMVDGRKIKQVLFNLLSNAMKFTPDNGSVIVEVRPLREDDRDFIEVSVSDTGIGIAPADQEKLFQPFQQVNHYLTKEHEGTGLGLALCKNFVEQHGGRIWVESEADQGATFGFTIPVRQDKLDEGAGT